MKLLWSSSLIKRSGQRRRVEHRTVNGKFKCELSNCKFSTNQEQSLKTHRENKHQRLYRYGCNFCEYKSYFKHSVISHQKCHHKYQGCKVLALDCELCHLNVAHGKHEQKKLNYKNKIKTEESLHDKIKTENLLMDEIKVEKSIKREIKIVNKEKVYI